MNIEEAKKLAKTGSAYAQFNLGCAYFNGNGVKVSKEKAVKWWKKAAKQGYVSAQWDLGNAYYYGYGVKVDKVKAEKWYAIAYPRRR